ncbi:FERM and PDZ domain-containing protein 2 [Tiliqua scincoides]|uniref:FERM and PDZ domain-containing protein 2 n=1 Tax=Tiliqua scincoides TaxID=71010 RepID=UPI0034638439
MSSSVTLSDVLQAKGCPLEEEEIWALMVVGTERLLEDLRKESSSYMICPWSILLSDEGSLSFRDNVPQENIAPFRAPETLCEHNKSNCGLTKMLMYSLGMTLYWSADYQLSPNQPLQLSDQLHTILLLLCEDLPHKRLSPESVLEACKGHQMQSSQYSANAAIKRLVKFVLGSIRQLLQNPWLSRNLRFSSEVTFHTHTFKMHVQKEKGAKEIVLKSASTMDETPNGIQKNSSHKVLCLGSSSTFSEPPKDSLPAPVLSRSVFQRKEKFSGPEFIILSNEPPVTLQLPGSIVTKKGKSYFSQRDVNVILLNGQCLDVKCNIKSKVQDVFNTVVAYANLMEHFYFGLAYMKGKEFFFLDDDTKLYKVAPEGWTDQHKKKTSIINFTVFLRIRFFVDDFNVIQHDLTRHQFYLQLRKDLLEERLYCNDKTILQLGALALQAELGNYAPEVHGKTYFRVEDYIPPHQIEKLTLEHIQFELAKLHRRTHSLFEEEAELEFLKVTQKLPEYGVFFHHVFQEKKTVGGDLVLGICAKGVIVYEVKNHTRIANVQFQWRETERISAHRKKFMIESSFSGKKHTFLTDTVKTCKYLLDLCSAQHRFNAQINSWQLLQAPSGDSRFMEIFRTHSAYISPRDELTLIQRLSRSENVLYGTNLESMSAEVISKSCDNLSVETSNENGEKSNLGRTPSRLFQSETHINLNDKQRSYDYLSIHSTQTTVSAPGSPCNQSKSSLTRIEREIISVTLKRDPKSGFGFVIIGGETVGKLDLGIFIASIIPGGPADRAGHIKPGGRLISVNNISLEGVSFNTAVQIIQNSPDEVQLIISQPKDGFEEGLNEERHLPRKISITSGSEISCIESEKQITEDCHTTPIEENGGVDNDPKKVISQNIAPKLVPKFPVSSADTLVPQEGYPLPPGESQGDDIYSVELTKENDSFGISVTGGISTNVLYGGIYVKAIIPNGPADKDGQIRKGDRLLEVDGISLCGVTQRQAVESLKKSKQVAKLVLTRVCHIPAKPSPGDNSIKDEHMSLSLTVPTLSESPKSTSFISDDNTFEVTLKKNSGGLGFSFLQMEGDVCERFGRDIVRIKRLFPGQPAEENGEIDVGDIILAVNGKSVQGLLYQEVLHLLRGAPPIVTLHLCRPPKGILPEIDQTSLSPLPSPAKEFVPSLEPSYGLDHTVSDEEDSSPAPNSPRAAHDGELWEVEHSLHEEQETSTKPLSKRDSAGERTYKHRWKIRQEAITSETFLSLEEEVRQGCYSPCELERAHRKDDLEFEKSDDNLTIKCYQPEICSPTPVDEEYLTISSTSFTPISHSGKSEVGTTLEPDGLGPTSISLSGKELCTSDDEWEDLEEVERDMKEQQDVRETKFSMSLTRSVNKSYGFTVVVNKMDNLLYVAEILGEPALSDGRLKIGDKLLMVNGNDATTLSAKETLAILRSSTCELHLVIGRTIMESSTSLRLDEIPEITLTKGDGGQLVMYMGNIAQVLETYSVEAEAGDIGLKLTGGVGSKQQGIYVLDIVPDSPACHEGSLQPLDEIVCICGLWTEGMSLDDAVRACDAASQIVHVRAIRFVWHVLSFNFCETSQLMFVHRFSKKTSNGLWTAVCPQVTNKADMSTECSATCRADMCRHRCCSICSSSFTECSLLLCYGCPSGFRCLTALVDQCMPC